MVPAGLGDVAIFTELGRFMLAPYGALDRKRRSMKSILTKSISAVDACAVNLMRPAMYGAYHHITVLGKGDASRVITSMMSPVRSARTTTSSQSTACSRRLIWVITCSFIHDAGAHGFAMGYNYNGKLKSAELAFHRKMEVSK